MPLAVPQNWILVDGCPVEGLGQGELLQSANAPFDFIAKIVLNSYERNCLRDLVGASMEIGFSEAGFTVSAWRPWLGGYFAF